MSSLSEMISPLVPARRFNRIQAFSASSVGVGHRDVPSAFGICDFREHLYESQRKGKVDGTLEENPSFRSGERFFGHRPFYESG